MVNYIIGILTGAFIGFLISSLLIAAKRSSRDD